MDFQQFLKDGPMVKDALEKGNDSLFRPRTGKRALSLQESGFVLQLSPSQMEQAWMVEYEVGASFQQDVYSGGFLMAKENVVVQKACACDNG